MVWHFQKFTFLKTIQSNTMGKISSNFFFNNAGWLHMNKSSHIIGVSQLVLFGKKTNFTNQTLPIFLWKGSRSKCQKSMILISLTLIPFNLIKQGKKRKRRTPLLKLKRKLNFKKIWETSYMPMRLSMMFSKRLIIQQSNRQLYSKEEANIQKQESLNQELCHKK